jgi:DNA-binding beta-propeller fold protein YncE
MKIFKTSFFILIVIICLLPLKILAISPGQFPDALRLQPIPPDVYPGNPGNINANEENSQNNRLLQQQINQNELNESELDKNTSYVDTIDHLLFVADTSDNRVLVFDLNQDNVLVDDIPDYVLGQPDFTTSAPGTTQSTLNNPNGIAYDPDSNKLFVADTNNNRIMVFDVSSISNGENAVNVLGQPDFTTSAPGTTQSTLNYPSGLAYDSKSNKVFVEDTNNNRVMVFGDLSISNGEAAINILRPNESSAMSPLIIARMQSKPKENPGSSPSKKISLGDILFWLVIFFVIVAIIVVYFLRFARNKKAQKTR